MGMGMGIGMIFENGYGCGYSSTRPTPIPKHDRAAVAGATHGRASDRAWWHGRATPSRTVSLFCGLFISVCGSFKGASIL